MSVMMPVFTLAQTTRSPLEGMLPIVAIGMAMMVFFILSSRSQEKRKVRDREAMYAAMSKNDRVLTIGGVVGTVLSVKENEVILKVDESTNTKMTFVKTAIQRVITDDAQLAEEKK